MKTIATSIFWILGAFILIAQKSDFPLGSIHQEFVSSDTSLSYQVYLPQSLEKTPAPILFISDPGGNAVRAIELFVAASEACQTILICSDQSRNGPFEINRKIFETIHKDVTNKIAFDSEIQLLAGFSGGSRLSTYLAVSKSNFCGVIACGSGLPVDERYRPSVISDFGYYGIMGKKDMNYVEMLEVEDYLKSIDLDHFFSFTNDAHKWPDPDELTKAITWQLARMEQKKKTLPSVYSNRFLARLDIVLEEIFYSGNMVEYAYSLSALKRLFPDMDFKDKSKKIDQSLLEVQKIERKKLIEKELKQIGLYYEEFGFGINQSPQAKPVVWWGKEYGNWTEIETNSTAVHSLQATRMKNFINGYAHQSFYKYMNNGEYEKAEWLSELLFQIAEQKAYGYFLQAKLKAVKKEYKEAEKKLGLAVKHGFNKKAHLLQSPAFEPMFERKGFKKILDSME